MVKNSTGPKPKLTKRVGKNYDLSVLGVITGGWEIFLKHYRPLIALAVLPMLFILPIDVIVSFVLPSSVTSFSDLTLAQQQAVYAMPFLALGAAIIGIVTNAGMIKSLLIAIQNDTKFTFNEAFSKGLKSSWAYIIVSALYALYVIGGLLLFIVPGLFFMVWYAFCIYIAFDQYLKATDALKASKEMVKGRGKLIVLVWAVLALVSGSLSFLPILGTLFSAVFVAYNTAAFTYMYFGYRDQRKK